MGCSTVLHSATLNLMRVLAANDLKMAPATADARTQPWPQRCARSAQERSAELARHHPGASICVVDEDPAVCAALLALFSAGGVQVMGFSHPRELLGHQPSDTEACVVVNLDSAGLDEVDLRHWIREQCACPAIYLSEHGDIPTAVRAIRQGAVDFLTKPVNDMVLLNSIGLALDRDAAIRARDADIAALQGRFSTLSPRERQVLPLIIGGLRNKQAAAVLGISEVTLQVHRSQLMHKTAARSFAELIRMSLLLGVAPATVVGT
jgi:FixJ family two-component response regulator